MIKLLILLSIVLSAMIAPVMADDLGFDDFKPDDPIGTLKDIGIWDVITLIISVVFALVVVAVVLGLTWCVGRVALSALRNDAIERKDAMGAMVGIISGVILFFCLITGFFFVWAML